MTKVTRRGLPNPINDGNTGEERAGKYGEDYTLETLNPKSLNDEGSYIVYTNPTAGTGIVTPMIAAFDNTLPTLLIKNTDTTQSGRRVYLDYVKMQLSVIGGGAPTILKYAFYIDYIERYGSGGTLLNGISPNGDKIADNKAKVYFGAITAIAAGNDKRLIANGVIRTVANVIGDTYLFTFGAKSPSLGNNELATVCNIQIPCPPVCLGAGQVLLLHLGNTGETTTGKTYLVDIGTYER